MKVFAVIHDSTEYMSGLLGVYSEREKAAEEIQNYVDKEWKDVDVEYLDINLEAGYAHYDGYYGYDYLTIFEATVK